MCVLNKRGSSHQLSLRPWVGWLLKWKKTCWSRISHLPLLYVSPLRLSCGCYERIIITCKCPGWHVHWQHPAQRSWSKKHCNQGIWRSRMQEWHGTTELQVWDEPTLRSMGKFPERWGWGGAKCSPEWWGWGKGWVSSKEPNEVVGERDRGH